MGILEMPKPLPDMFPVKKLPEWPFRVPFPTKPIIPHTPAPFDPLARWNKIWVKRFIRADVARRKRERRQGYRFRIH